MNISVEVTGELLDYLDTKVKSGLFKSRSEIIRTAIRDMIHSDIEELLRSKGIDPEKFAKMRAKAAGELIAKKYGKLG